VPKANRELRVLKVVLQIPVPKVRLELKAILVQQVSKVI
jgi:hypothetical protein